MSTLTLTAHPARRLPRELHHLPAQRVKARPQPPRPTARATRPTAALTTAPLTGPVRLTRRGRVVVTLFLLALVLAASAFLSSQSAATRDPGPPVPTRTVVVHQGDTLWAIASTVAGSRDIREVVNEIETYNSLPGPALVEGQKLAVPLR